MARRIGILGCGRMASAMVARWLETGTVAAGGVRACTRRAETAEQVQATLGIACGTDPAAVIGWADHLVLAVKPQQATSFLQEFGSLASSAQVWLSVLAGVEIGRLERDLPPGTEVFRLMPNTPVRYGQGLVGVARGQRATDATAAEITSLLAPLGEVVPVAEAQMDAFTAVAGSGPAYVFRFLEALQAAAEGVGFDPDTAATLARQVVAGASELSRRDPRPAAQLRAEVTSPGGTTAAALGVIESSDWEAALVRAVAAAAARGAELARMTAPTSPPSA